LQALVPPPILWASQLVGKVVECFTFSSLHWKTAVLFKMGGNGVWHALATAAGWVTHSQVAATNQKYLFYG